MQAPPNLAYDDFPLLLDAGIDDWGGVSPVTVDHVNPEAPWPEVERLREACRSRGLELAPRLPLYPEHVADLDRWADPAVAPAIRRAADAHGLAREDRWAPGEPVAVPFVVGRDPAPLDARRRASSARRSSCGSSRPAARERERVFAAADRLRREVCGDDVTYVVTRNIQYTNVCYFRCGFCAFSKGKLAENLRGPAYLVPDEEIVAARARGVGARRDRGVPPGRDPPVVHGRLLRGRRRDDQGRGPRRSTSTRSRRSRSGRAPRRSGSTSRRTSRGCATSGLGSLPGTAAEILDDEVRAIICPGQGDDRPVARGARGRAPGRAAVERDDHVRPRRAARALGAAPAARARAAGAVGRVHRVRAAAVRPDGGADLPRRPRAARADVRRGAAACTPSRGSRSIPLITNIQASWVKLGPDGVRQALAAGVNDLGGTLMNESISRAAGSEWGQELPPEQMEALIRSAGRVPRQRTTTYGDAARGAGAPLVRRGAARRDAEPAGARRGAAAAGEAAAPGGARAALAGVG